eukprot:741309-Prymnesium_polylepis.1
MDANDQTRKTHGPARGPGQSRMRQIGSGPQAQEGPMPRPRCSHAIADRHRAASSPAARPANAL